jgi:hypothetical protein
MRGDLRRLMALILLSVAASGCGDSATRPREAASDPAPPTSQPADAVPEKPTRIPMH